MSTEKHEKHEKHQAMLQDHKEAKANRRDDHNHPGRKKKIPPNSLV